MTGSRVTHDVEGARRRRRVRGPMVAVRHSLMPMVAWLPDASTLLRNGGMGEGRRGITGMATTAVGGGCFGVGGEEDIHFLREKSREMMILSLSNL